jgi:hypothetical protein
VGALGGRVAPFAIAVLPRYGRYFNSGVTIVYTLAAHRDGCKESSGLVWKKSRTWRNDNKLSG